MIQIEAVTEIAAREPVHALALGGVQVLAAKPAGIAIRFQHGGTFYSVSRLEGEDGWTLDGKTLANGFPVFFNGEGARYCITRQIDDAEIVSELNAAAAAA